MTRPVANGKTLGTFCDNGAIRSVLTVIAVDAYLEGKMRDNERIRLYAHLILVR